MSPFVYGLIIGVVLVGGGVLWIRWHVGRM